MPDSTPLVSFGLPVRNGAPTLGEAIESLQAQTVPDWELVVSDNLSTDLTEEICASYAAKDARIRHIPTGRDLTQNENFCEAFRHARGGFFRWYGDDDWLEPTYLERTLAAFDEASEAVLCTTVQQYYRDEVPVPTNDPVTRLGGVVSSDGGERVRELLRLFEHGGHLGIDPVYSLVRRDVAATTNLISPIREGDFTFSCEMAIRGPFTHVAEVLAHRRLAGASRSAIPPQGIRGRKPWSPYVQRELSILHLTRVSDSLGSRSRLRMIAGLVGYAAREHADGLVRRARGLAGRA
jgi:glycosyltransferase involved in cell wall biosynthesis